MLFESKELGIIGPNKCGYVKLLNTVIEYKPGVFQWHTDVKHARAVIELVGLDVKTSPGKTDSAGGQLRNAEDELDDEDRRACRSAAGTLLYHTLDKPDVACKDLRVSKVKHLALLKHIARYLEDKQDCAGHFPVFLE